MNKIRSLFKFRAYIFLFVILWLISYRHFFTFDYQVVGHNWDWNFPALPLQLQRLYLSSLFYWDNLNLGRPLNLQSHMVINLLVSSLAYFMTIKQIIILMLFSVSFIAFLGYKSLIDYFLIRSPYNYIPALLFAFSPFLFNEIIGGSWYMWISYAITPYVITTFAEYLSSGHSKKLFFYVILSLFSIVSLQNFVLTEFIVILHLVYKVFVKEASLITIKRYIYSHVFLVFFNAYWLIPFIYSSKNLFSLFISDKFTGNFIGVANSSQNILSLLGLYGYLDRNMYLYALPLSFRGIFALLLLTFWVLTILTFVTTKKGVLKSRILYWLLLGMIVMLIAKGGSPPIGSLTMFVFNNFPLMSLYRSPQHLVLGMAIVVPIIAAYTFHYYFFSKNHLYKVVIPLFFVLVWIGAWWVTGDIGSTTLASQKKDYIDFYSTSPELHELYLDDLHKADGYSRTIFLPPTCSPLYLPNEYQGRAQGGIPEYNFLKNSTVCSESNALGLVIEEYFCNGTNLNITNLLKSYSIDKIVLRNDIKPTHTRCGTLDNWDMDKVRRLLEANKEFTLITAGSQVSTYGISKDEIRETVSIPSKIIIDSMTDTKSEADIIYKLANTDPAQLTIFDNQLEERTLDQLSSIQSQASIRYEQVSPVKFRINIYSDNQPFLVNFTYNYDPGWRLVYESSNFFNSLFVKTVSVQHLVTNGHSNGWIVDPVSVCQDYSDACQQDNNGYELTIVIEYWPQRIFYLGIIVSVFSLLIFIVFERRQE